MERCRLGERIPTLQRKLRHEPGLPDLLVEKLAFEVGDIFHPCVVRREAGQVLVILLVECRTFADEAAKSPSAIPRASRAGLHGPAPCKRAVFAPARWRSVA